MISAETQPLENKYVLQPTTCLAGYDEVHASGIITYPANGVKSISIPPLPPAPSFHVLCLLVGLYDYLPVDLSF